MENYVGKRVRHKYPEWGGGVVVRQAGNRIYVSFTGVQGEKAFIAPHAFERGFLILVDDGPVLPPPPPPPQRAQRAYWAFMRSQVAFDAQIDGGYLWAPQADRYGKTYLFWERMLELRKGDLVFCSLGGAVQAIAVVKSSAVSCPMPNEMKGIEPKWGEKAGGWRLRRSCCACPFTATVCCL